MIDSYIIINRKPKFIIKIFLFITILIILLVIWAINTLYINSFINVQSHIINSNSYFLLKVLVPQKEVKKITSNKLILNNKLYNYTIYRTEDKITYKNNINYLTLYLIIHNLEEEYKINGYHTEVKIIKKKEKIINYLKE